MRILFLCHRIPYPPDKGEKIRAFHQLTAIAARHEVDLFTLADDAVDMAHRASLLEYCREVTVVQVRPISARLRALPFIFTRTALTIPYFYSRELQLEVRKALRQRSYDRIFVYCSAMAQYVDSVDDIPIMTDLVDVDSDKWRQYALATPFPFSAVYRREALRLREYERKICENSTLPPEEVSAGDQPNPTAAYLVPFLAILAAGMVSNAFSARFEWLYSLRFFAAVAALLLYRDSYRALDWRFSWRGPAAGGIVFFFWIALERWSHVPASSAMPVTLSIAPAALRVGWIVFRFVAAVVTVPIAEELAFRGYLLRRLTAPDFESVRWRAVTWIALVISSALFGAMHGQRWLAGTVAGVIYGWLVIRRGRIGEAMAAHAATNALIAVYVLALGQWQLW